MKTWTFVPAQLSLTEVENGLLIRQHDDCYIARYWRLTPDVEFIAQLAMNYGLVCMIQNRHPQTNNRGAKGDGTVYMSFARRSSEYWVLTIDQNSSVGGKKPSGILQQVLINKQYRHALQEASIPHDIESFSNASNIQVPFAYAEAALLACSPYIDRHAQRRGRSGHDGQYPGFRDEADIERWLMEKLEARNILDRRWKILGRQVRTEVGMMDILLQDLADGTPIILEAKQGRAQPRDVREQLHRYVNSEYVRKRFGPIAVVGCLFAEKIERTVVEAVADSTFPALAFEIQWLGPDNVQIRHAAGEWPEHPASTSGPHRDA